MTDPGERGRDGPLAGLRVVDLSTLLPGPLASLILAEAGAEVTKIERPEGDPLRAYPPRGAAFALLNRGKRSLALDLKDPAARARLLTLVDAADVLIEQFRPGVMARLGLDYDTLAARNPRLVYCSITGYGQNGPKAGVAGHDLNYLADSGLLALGAGPDGAPVIPPGLIADIGGGALPAVINILMALRAAAMDGRGRHLDIAMTDGLFAWQWWAQAELDTGGRPPAPGRALLTGGSPRYQIYRTACGRHLAVAPLEQKFWDRFCELIDLPDEFRATDCAPERAIAAVAAIIGARDAAHWERCFDGEDVCCNLVRDPAEARADPQVAARDLFAAGVTLGATHRPALPPPLAPCFRPRDDRPAPSLEGGSGPPPGRGRESG